MVDRSELFEDLKSWTLKLPGVTQASHRFGGTEFQIEGLEFMHHHGPSFLDIRLSRNDQATALKAGTAIPHRFAPQAGWVSFRIEKPEDLESAKKLIQLAYENARTTMEAHRARRGQSKLG
jgi:luciferase-like monooxygenase